MLSEEKREKQFIKSMGKKIKSIRLAKGIRQNEIAYRCNFDKSSFSNIEAGKRNITILSLYKIANALEVPLSVFFEDLDYPK